MRGARLAALALIVAACSSGSTSDDVPWDSYAPELRGRIDGLQLDGDCAGLQAEFDQADANDDAQRARTGEGNAALMGYIDDALRAAGCYGD